VGLYCGIADALRAVIFSSAQRGGMGYFNIYMLVLRGSEVLQYVTWFRPEYFIFVHYKTALFFPWGGLKLNESSDASWGTLMGVIGRFACWEITSSFYQVKMESIITTSGGNKSWILPKNANACIPTTVHLIAWSSLHNQPRRGNGWVLEERIGQAPKIQETCSTMD